MTGLGQLPATVAVSLSSQLRAATKPDIRWDYSGDGAATPVELPWRPPVSVSQMLRDDARRGLQLMDSALAPASGQQVKDWLIALGNLCAGQMTAADARVKIAAYSAMLEFPPLCYTRDTLRKAAEKFKWWPSYGELAEFLEDVVRPQHRLRDRIKDLSAAPVAAAAEQQPISVEERQRVGEKFGELRRQLAQTMTTAPAGKNAEWARGPRHVGHADYTLGRKPAPEENPAATSLPNSAPVAPMEN